MFADVTNTMIEDTDKIRRVINLCVLFTRNMAYYRASYDGTSYIAGGNDFSVTCSGNFIDVSIIEWCKLFGSYGDNHHWRNLVGESAPQFSNDMFKHIAMSEAEFRDYHKIMKNYRDVFAAHWDDNGKGKRPHLDKAFECVEFLHEYIFEHFSKAGQIQDKVRDLRSYYDVCYMEAKKYYQALN